ncbi:serine hydrolase [Paenibacillus selenitireducens]|uniref:Serine hydrolase n=1 Tax=Paenibacillus selenitireducens TaxID=1324314 RepID=A0A1T2X5T4_9BACL|nr:serine hydrolase [Paenibacillus selenitireducens]OPA75249.1 serine hydrolase [Paenibacillus selenitireducens]
MKYEWLYSTPEAEGMDSKVLDEIDAYIQYKQYRLVNSILVVKNGNIVFEKYYNQFDEHSRNSIKSIWKSILAIVTGICLDKGILQSLDEPIAAYLPEFAQHLHPYHKLITVRHLLTMSSGLYWNGGVHYHCPMILQMKRTRDWTSYMADIAMSSVPGMNYQYKEWDVMLLSAVIGFASGGTAYDIAKAYLYDPLDIESGVWPQSPNGFSYTIMEGEEESDLSARDLAKIGLMFLQEGRFGGEQIISSQFVRQALTPACTEAYISPSSTHSSYGFLWWLEQEGYGCRGYGGQEMYIIPEHQYISIIQATPTPRSKMYGDLRSEFLRKAIL